MSVEQSMKALDRANEIRIKRAELKRCIRSGEIRMTQILEEETMELSEKVLDWWETSSQLENERDDRLFTYPIPSAQIALQTKYEWRCAVEGRLGYVNIDRGVVDRRLFDSYTTLIRAKAPTRKVSALAYSDLNRILMAFLRSMST